ncbi:RNA capping enzyme nuclear [Leishmania donovani]|uniref:mRNA (guanine-N(7))-methyltransferase n=1 Tax=Leishmania donovani TaxID=5661 RepID=A0A6J8FF99_LEIDO|nr:RNA capping enzyme nuclear [Leishmania donovani]VDZ44586.1 RNA_capping_enzyme_nuclear/GeneDB:LmjF.22.0090 [Leishmania donovani]
MQLQSLKALSEASKDEPHHRWCCHANDAWYNAVHADGEADVSDAQMPDVEAALEGMLSDASPLCADMLQCVLRHANVTLNPNDAEFPGPMCTPLCKKDTARLRQHGYTVTEKSDGIRVVVVSMWAPRFPAWVADSAADAVSASVNLSHLASVLALERARRALRRYAGQGEDAAFRETLSLGGRSCTLELFSALEPCESECFTLRVATAADDASPSALVTLRRHRRGRHFAYAVDRSLDAAYLFMDDHTTLQYHTFVLDAELMSVHRSATSSPAVPRLVLGAFDLFAYAGAADNVLVNMAKRSMVERYDALKAVVHTCALPVTTDECGYVSWYVKDMWALADIGACLAKLRYSAESQCFLYDGPHGPTENDGLIFTPDEFPVVVGSSSVQLKWKWQHLLSIDWLLQASDKQPDMYTVSLFFVKKNYGHREDVAGHWRLRKPMHILNPHGFEMPVDAAVVAECAYDEATQRWYIQRLRPDKLGANSIITAISVYESLVENISLPHLLELLQVDAEKAKGQADALESAARARVGTLSKALETVSSALDAAEAEKCVTAKLALRAIRESRGNAELYLIAYTNNTNKTVMYPLPFPLRKIRDCIGLGYHPGIRDDTPVPSLEEVLYIQLANAGGCYAWSDYVVDAFYDGDSGYWEIIHADPRGNNKEAIFDNVIEHLDWLLRHRTAPEAATLLERKRDAPLVLSRPPSSEATQQTSRHYGTVAKELANEERSDLRRFNNWVKSVLLTTMAAAIRRTLKPLAKLHVLDLCCGRGGDLLKWQHIRPAFLFMTDASVECVAEAAARYSTSEGQSVKVANGKQKGFPAFFAVHDAFDAASGLREDLLKRGPFQLTSCQFSMHYGCRSKESMRYFVKAIADSLVPHGRFVGTTVSDVELLYRAKEHGAEFGNDVYGVRFGAEAFAQLQSANFEPAALSFGVPYTATVERSVKDMTEYVVPWDAFVALCAEHQLKLVLEDNFIHYYGQHKDTEAGKAMTLEQRRKRHNDGGVVDCPLSPSEQAAVGLYRLFVFEKTKAKQCSFGTAERKQGRCSD